MEIIRIGGESLPFFSAYIPINRVAAVKSGRCCALGAVSDGLAAGAVVLEESGADAVTIVSLRVDEKARGRGLGRALLDAAGQVTVAFGGASMETVYALPEEQSRKAAAFLTKNGFSPPEKCATLHSISLAELARCPALWRQSRQDPGSRIVALSELESDQRAALESPGVPKALRPSRFGAVLNTEYSLAWLCGGTPAAYCVVTDGPDVYTVAAVFAFPNKGAMAARLLQALARRGAALPGETMVQLTTVNEQSARLAEEFLASGKMEKRAQYICARRCI